MIPKHASIMIADEVNDKIGVKRDDWWQQKSESSSHSQVPTHEHFCLRYNRMDKNVLMQTQT